MYAICRVEKLKSMSNVAGANGHNKRLENAPNADFSKANDNVHMGAKNAPDAIQKLLAKHEIKPRKNAVLANEYLLSASPEFFKDKSTSEIKKWAKDNLEFLKEKHGEGLISFDLHLDESTPHIHAIVCPIYENSKGQIKLSASQYFDRNKLKSLQTDYAEAMKHHGLERGIENSRAKHTEIKKYYGELEKEVKQGTKNAKESIKEFKAFEKKEPGFFSKTRFIQEAKNLVKKLTTQIVKLEKLNAALKSKFEHKIEQLQGQMHEYKKSHEQLERLYEVQGLSKDDTERFNVLESRCVSDTIKRAEELSRSSEKNNSNVISPAQAQSNIDWPTLQNKVQQRESVRLHQKTDNEMTLG